MMRSSNSVRNHGAKVFSLRFWICTMMLMALPALASVSIPLLWNPSIGSTVAGYKIYYGVKSHVYTNSVDVGNVTNTTITGLAANTTYYFAGKTYDQFGIESAFSNEARVNDAAAYQPTLNPIGNLTVHFKTTITIGLSGISTGWPSGKKFKFTAVSSNPKVVANPSVKYSSSKTTGTLTIKPAANTNATATITVTLNNGAPSNNILTRTFIVTVEPAAIPAKKTVADQIAVSASASSADGFSPNLTDDSSTPAILTPVPCVTGQFALCISGITNYQCVVQASTNLKDWVSVQTNTAPFTFVDSNASQFSQRFYRTVNLP